jgi:hypothetical protein
MALILINWILKKLILEVCINFSRTWSFPATREEGSKASFKIKLNPPSGFICM